VRPRPRKIALLLSVLGLGMPLSQRAAASSHLDAGLDKVNEHVAANVADALGLANSADAVSAPASLEVPSGGLDIVLESPDEPVVSAARDALGLATAPEPAVTAVAISVDRASAQAPVWDPVALARIADPDIDTASPMAPPRREPDAPAEAPSPPALPPREPWSRTSLPEPLLWSEWPDAAPGEGDGTQVASQPVDDAVPVRQAISIEFQIVPDESSADIVAEPTHAVADASAATASTAIQPAVSDDSRSCAASDFSWPDEDFVVVASHEERVLRSLEALLSGDDASAARFGAQTRETVVHSESEKVLAVLAAVQERPHGDVDTAASVTAPPALDIELPLVLHAEEELRGAQSSNATASSSRWPGQAELVAVAENKLDRIRGGFTTDNGLQIAFGIERAVYLNGSLVTTTSLNVSDLGKVTGGSAGPPNVATAGSNLSLVQNGSGNVFSIGSANSNNVGTFIQNTLNDQKIQSITTINATVNSLQVLKSINFSSSLRGALVDSLRR